MATGRKREKANCLEKNSNLKHGQVGFMSLSVIIVYIKTIPQFTYVVFSLISPKPLTREIKKLGVRESVSPLSTRISMAGHTWRSGKKGMLRAHSTAEKRSLAASSQMLSIPMMLLGCMHWP